MKHNQTGLLLFLMLIFFFALPLIAADLDGLQVKFGGDAFVRGFSTEKDKSLKSQGYAQMLRLKLDITTEDRISVRTQTILSANKWNGDSAEQAISGNSSDAFNGGNPVRLDYGYIEAPLPKGWMARAGRQAANFSDCFNTCDDRRDRLMLFKLYGNLMPAILFDKRTEGALNKEGDDGDMYAAALFHLHARHEWALLYATWLNDDKSYVLRNVHNFSPYYKYKGDKFTGMIVWNWLGLGSRGSWYHGHHNSMAIKGEYRFHKNFDFSFQGIMSEDGGLVAPGYDTYSFIVNNDPDNNRSNSRLVTLGGYGSFTGGALDDEHFIISRLRYFNGRFKAALAVGRAREFVNPNKQDLMIYDFQVQFQYSKSLLFKAGVALVREDRLEEASLFQVETSF